jgi:putative N-acetyltransferase (TIGR04045 family)
MAVAASRSHSRAASARARPHAVCRLAASPQELAAHYAIRRAAFVEEQAIFTGDDRDGRDAEALHAVGLVGDVVAGAVRLYPLDADGRWKGDRLAVLAPFRSHGLGAPLVRFAVRTAAARGGRVMEAFVQPQNAAFFLALGWRRVGDVVEYVGHPHQRMEIALGAGAAVTEAP